MLRLVKVNRDNWQECIKLPTSEDHAHFVAPNVYSIAEAQFYPGVVSACIYADDEMVGYTMYGREEEDESLFWIDRLMIAEGQRGKGYGRAALLMIIDEAKSQGFLRVGLSTAPENSKAIQLYENVGFKATGEIVDDEAVFVCDFSQISSVTPFG
jgi:diamine N-acetyltransferase